MKNLLLIAVCLIFIKCSSDGSSGCETPASFGEFKSSKVSYTSVQLSGGILIEDCSPSIIEKGIVYGKEVEPTVSDSKKIINTTIYSVGIKDLEKGTKYYFREFVTFSDETLYGEQLEVSTLANVPVDTCKEGMYNEKNGKIIVEFESTKELSGWDVETSATGFSGSGYLVWNGGQHLSTPDTGIIDYKLRVTTAGTYQFIWNSRVTHGNNGTDHNDTWLSFPDLPAGKFYGQKNNSIVYPKGLGLTPNPKGSSSSGFFKIYKSGPANEWRWHSLTSDNEGYSIFLNFDVPGIYTMRIAVRSAYHALDKFVLFKTDLPAPTGDSEELSEICN
jgi:hypothetical protein